MNKFLKSKKAQQIGIPIVLIAYVAYASKYQFQIHNERRAELDEMKKNGEKRPTQFGDR
jgi:hypothetical protein